MELAVGEMKVVYAEPGAGYVTDASDRMWHLAKTYANSQEVRAAAHAVDARLWQEYRYRMAEGGAGPQPGP
jgi:hypothetical protein